MAEGRVKKNHHLIRILREPAPGKNFQISHQGEHVPISIIRGTETRNAVVSNPIILGEMLP